MKSSDTAPTRENIEFLNAEADALWAQANAIDQRMFDDSLSDDEYDALDAQRNELMDAGLRKRREALAAMHAAQAAGNF